jgi:hypothetical protein
LQTSHPSSLEATSPYHNLTLFEHLPTSLKMADTMIKPEEPANAG